PPPRPPLFPYTTLFRSCDDGSPGLPIIRCLVNVGGHVSKRMAVKCSISSASVIQPRLDPGNPRKLWKVCHITYDVVPGFSTIARDRKSTRLNSSHSQIS